MDLHLIDVQCVFKCLVCGIEFNKTTNRPKRLRCNHIMCLECVECATVPFTSAAVSTPLGAVVRCMYCADDQYYPTYDTAGEFIPTVGRTAFDTIINIKKESLMLQNLYIEKKRCVDALDVMVSMSPCVDDIGFLDAAQRLADVTDLYDHHLGESNKLVRSLS